MGTNSKSSHQCYVVAPTVPIVSMTTAANAAPQLDDPSTSVATQFDEHPQAAPAELAEHQADPAQPSDTAELDQAPPDEVPADDSGEQVPIADAGDLDTQPLTPVPDTPMPGQACGQPVLVGGADLVDSTATLVSYLSPDGPRTVLHTVVDQGAEAKLLEALHLSDTEMVAVQIEQQVHGRLPVDKHHQVLEALVTAAKSVNHHIGVADLTADTCPSATTSKITAAQQAVEALQQAVGNNPSKAEAAMLAHYQQHLAAIMESATTGTVVEHVTGYVCPGLTTMITTYVPKPQNDPPEGKLPAVLRDATRIKPTIDSSTGEASWDGIARHQGAKGKEYVIDLGEGYTAVYRPYSANDPAKSEYSLRGRLEIIAPAGTGHGPQLVRRLGQLHLTNRPMTAAEGEYTYLQANITAQQLTHAAIDQAHSFGDHLEEMTRQELFHARAHQAVGMTSAELARFARDIQLEAATAALPAKVTALRDAIAHATGHPNGDALAATPGYDPTPRRSGGWLTWTRFDVGNNTTALTAKITGRCLSHQVGQGSLAAMLTTGVLASTERRTLMGTKTGIGMSESDDKFTGGASSVFLRVRDQPPDATTSKSYGWSGCLIWDNPERLLARADYYGANSDTFGAINPAHSKSGHSTRDPFKIASFTSSSNEVMFNDGIDLLGAEAPSRIICHNTAERDQIRALLTAKGITTLGGKPINQVVL